MPTGYSAWALTNFGGAIGPDTEPDGDFDRDGKSNLLEYALGGDPSVPGACPEPRFMPDGGNLLFIYERDLSLPDVGYQVQGSLDLNTWIDANDVLVETNGNREVRQSSIPAAVVGRIFMRLEITLQ